MNPQVLRRLFVTTLAIGGLLAGCTTLPEAPLPPPRASVPMAPPPPPPAPMPVPLHEKISYTTEAYFAPTSTALSPAAAAALAELAAKTLGLSLDVIMAVGHADATEAPTAAAAAALSVARAQAVKAYLVRLGVEPARVYTEGQGRSQPVADNATASNRSKNRRVEIELVATRASSTTAPRALPKGHVPVLFGTNRAKTGKNAPGQYFGSDESEAEAANRLTLGRVTVRVPPHRQQGELKQPGLFWVALESITASPLASAVGIRPIPSVNPDTDFSFVGALDEFTDLAFSDTLKASIARSRSKTALVYVHGFANSFQDAAFRTAQFAYDLADEHYDVVPVLFSWPSDPAKFNYLGAGDRTWSAGKQLAVFLDKLTATTGAGVVHVVAHSKGAQVLALALETLRTPNLLAVGADGVKLVPRFRQIILAAPDIRASDFQSIVLPAVASHHSITNYVSSNDAALRAAKKANVGPRAGDSGNATILVKGVETIDVTAVNYEPGGHSSFAESPRVIADIRQQLAGKKPADRQLQRVTRSGLGYWLLKD